MKAEEVIKNVFTIDHFLSPEECDQYISFSEELGYDTATVATEKGEKLLSNVRNNDRVLYYNEALALKLWDRAKDLIPSQIGKSVAVGLNELIRFYKYQPGQKFNRHIDESYIRNEMEASYYTFMVYLNDEFDGGETKFDNIHIRSHKGLGLIFLHSLPHEGAEVKKGIKYILRTDIMYRLEEDSNE